MSQLHPTSPDRLHLDKEELAAVATAALQNIVPSGVQWVVTCVDEKTTVSAETGVARRQYVLRIATDNVPLTLGQFDPFTQGGLRGYNCNYIYGYIHGHFAGRRGADLWAEAQLVIDVDRSASGNPRPVYQCVSVQSAVDRNILAADGPLHQALTKRKLQYVLMSGDTLSGPSLGMMEIVESVVQLERPATMLDLFSGSGTLARVGCAAGARSVVCVDAGVDEVELREALGPFAERCEVKREDAFEFQLDDVFDLVVLDPFYEATPLVVSRVLPRFRGRFKTMIVNLGPPEPRSWMREVEREVARAGLRGTRQEHAGETIAVFRASDS